MGELYGVWTLLCGRHLAAAQAQSRQKERIVSVTSCRRAGWEWGAFPLNCALGVPKTD